MKKYLLIIAAVLLSNSTTFASTFLKFNIQDTTKNALIKDSSLNGLLSTDSLINKDSLQKSKFYYGIASYYSNNLEGSETSTQETFRHNKMTAASNRFKLNTWLRVTNIFAPV